LSEFLAEENDELANMLQVAQEILMPLTQCLCNVHTIPFQICFEVRCTQK